MHLFLSEIENYWVGNAAGRLTCKGRWSTCVLVSFSWLLDHVIYLNIRRENILCKAEQIQKMKLTIVLNEHFVILSENSCEFVNLLSFI